LIADDGFSAVIAKQSDRQMMVFVRIGQQDRQAVIIIS